MIYRKSQEMHTAIQIYKSYNQIIFRIYANVKPLPKHLHYVHDIYELIVDLSPPYGCWVNNQFVRNFTNYQVAWSILLERIRTLSKQFGFTVPYAQLNKWHKWGKELGDFE